MAVSGGAKRAAVSARRVRNAGGRGRAANQAPIDRAQTALVLSAGAPNAPLAAGFLSALYDAGHRFPLIYASGGGVIIALLLIAHRERSPRAAFEKFVEGLGVADEIYKVLPVGYKTFRKPELFGESFREWFDFFKLGDSAPGDTFRKLKRRYEREILNQTLRKEADRASFRRLYNDLIDLAAAVVTPPFLTLSSQGLCEPLPWLEEVVDFDKLRQWPGKLYIPAYSVSSQRDKRNIQVFCSNPRIVRRSRTDMTGRKLKLIDADAVRASLASPFIYPPVRVGGEPDPYIEGAYEDPYNEEAFLNELRASIRQKADPSASGRAPPRDRRRAGANKISNLLILDLLSTREMQMALMGEPFNLWDAYGQSILTPIVAHAKEERYKIKQDIAAFNEVIRKRVDEAAERARRSGIEPDEIEEEINVMPTVEFGVKPNDRIMEWRYSNLKWLFDRGRETGFRYLRQPISRQPISTAQKVPLTFSSKCLGMTNESLLPTEADFQRAVKRR